MIILRFSLLSLSLLTLSSLFPHFPQNAEHGRVVLYLRLRVHVVCPTRLEMWLTCSFPQPYASVCRPRLATLMLGASRNSTRPTNPRCTWLLPLLLLCLLPEVCCCFIQLYVFLTSFSVVLSLGVTPPLQQWLHLCCGGVATLHLACHSDV